MGLAQLFHIPRLFLLLSCPQLLLAVEEEKLQSMEMVERLRRIHFWIWKRSDSHRVRLVVTVTFTLVATITTILIIVIVIVVVEGELGKISNPMEWMKKKRKKKKKIVGL